MLAINWIIISCSFIFYSAISQHSSLRSPHISPNKMHSHRYYEPTDIFTLISVNVYGPAPIQNNRQETAKDTYIGGDDF